MTDRQTKYTERENKRDQNIYICTKYIQDILWNVKSRYIHKYKIFYRKYNIYKHINKFIKFI